MAEDDLWAGLVDPFADGAYASAKGLVRTYVMHQHLLEHLPPPPATILDVGGGAGHQSLPLARAGWDVTLLDSSVAMLARARERLDALPAGARHRVRLLHAEGEHAVEAVAGQQFDAVLCHGVLGYLDDPVAMVEQLCRCAAPGGIVSILTGNARTSAVRPALERRWQDALAAFDDPRELGVLGVPTRGDDVEHLSGLLEAQGVQAVQWYGVWLFTDWLEFSGTTVDLEDPHEVAAMAQVELEASRRDPYRQLSRPFHLVGRRPG